jgi:hypothetical protein
MPSGVSNNDRVGKRGNGTSKLAHPHGGNSAVRRHPAPGQGGSAAERHIGRVPSNQRSRVGLQNVGGSALESANQRLSNQANGGSALGGASMASVAERSPMNGKRGPLVASSKLQMANIRNAANNSNQSTKENSLPPAPVVAGGVKASAKIAAE